MTRKKVPEATKRIVFLRSHGRCEYLNCGKVVASTQENYSFSVTGEFAHIIPVGDGPRFEFKKPGMDLDQPDNIILLCREHHRMIDHEAVAEHPPAVLFSMFSRRSEWLEKEIDSLFSDVTFGFDCQHLAEEVRIGRIVTLLNKFRLDGPALGRDHLNDARRLLKEIERNPHVELSLENVALINLAISALAASVAYDSKIFTQELRRAERCFRNVTNVSSLITATFQMMVFVRDENGILDTEQRLSIIKNLLTPIEKAIKETEDDSIKAGLLGVKSALVRWRARIGVKIALANSLNEAKGCASASLNLKWSCHGRLQLGLSRYAHASSLPNNRSVEYSSEITAADEAILDKRLDNYAAAVKYRPRYFRQTHRWDDALRSFSLAVDMGFERDMQSVAFLAGEAAASAYSNGCSALGSVDKANAFLADAVAVGFDHGRNLLAWVFTRALLHPSWFDSEFVGRLEGGDGKAKLDEILKDLGRRYLNIERGHQDVLFGISEVEFWNSVARSCQVALRDPETALKYYSVAQRYSRRVAGNFVTRMGIARCNLELGHLSEAKSHCAMASDVALASHIGFVDLLRSRISLAENETTSTPT